MPRENEYLKIEVTDDGKVSEKKIIQQEKEKSEMLFSRIKKEVETKYYINKVREYMQRMRER